MKIFRNIYLSVFIVLVSAFSLYALRTVSVSHIWKNYEVLYADKNAEENTVLEVLHSQGISGILSRNSQRLLFTSEVTPVVPPEFNDYLENRLNYFSDKTASLWNLYYIPLEFENQVDEALKVLSAEKSIKCGVDRQKYYTWIVPLLVFLTFAFLLTFSKNKLVFAFSSVFYVFLSVTMPFYSTGAGIILLLSANFLCLKLWNRKGAFSVMKSNIYVILLFASGISVVALSSLKSLAGGILCLLCSFAMVNIYSFFRQLWERKYQFNYVPIFSAKCFVPVTKQNLRKVFYCTVPVFLFGIFFFTSASFSLKKSPGSVQLPVPVSEENKDFAFPVLEDYHKWAWNIFTFPYRNLNKYNPSAEIKDGDYVSMMFFEDGESGIKTYETAVYTYDEDFRSTLDDVIEKSENGDIEKLLVSEGENLSVGFGKPLSENKSNAGGFSLLLIIFSAAVLVSLWIYFNLSGCNKNEKNS
ncbi:MAG: hypothetical protein SO116_06495 [Treponema sp.]|nr:hypothetical protein [Treponema sp.]